jgi:hypothetical protein
VRNQRLVEVVDNLVAEVLPVVVVVAVVVAVAVVVVGTQGVGMLVAGSWLVVDMWLGLPQQGRELWEVEWVVVAYNPHRLLCPQPMTEWIVIPPVT